MPHLAGQPMTAPVEVTVDHDAGSDAGANGQIDQSGSRKSGAPPSLSQRSAVRVVIHGERYGQPLKEERRQRYIPPGQMG
jgi:hypothetical protein